MSTKTTICFVGGGTGGHILPAITLAKKWHDKTNGRVIFLTSFIALDKNLDKKMLDKPEFITNYFRNNLIKPPANKPWLLPLFMVQLIWSFIKSAYIFMYYEPDRVVSTGGYISIPVCLAAKFLGIPIDLYDVNAVPGKAATFLARITKNIYVTYKSCQKKLKGAQIVDYPVRFEESDKTYKRRRN